LQEVAAARQVDIICGATEIDGHAFSTRLSSIELSKLGSNPDSQTITFRQTFAVTSLIRGAIFRSKYKPSSSMRATLGICSLGELMSMYNTHQTSRRHDKIYALLGMASDDLSDASLLPDYSVPWQELQERLFHFVLCHNISVKTCPGKEEVEIEGKGHVLGRVRAVKRGSNGGQDIGIVFNGHEQLELQKDDLKWSLQSTANGVCEGDIIYLLEGCASPMIIRPLQVTFYIIAIAAESTIQVRCENRPRQISLVWDWAKLPTDSTNVPSRASAEVRSYWNTALVLSDSGFDARAWILITRLKKVLSLSETTDQTGVPTGTKFGPSSPDRRGITPTEVADIVQRFKSDGVTKLLLWIPREIFNTETVLIAIMQHHQTKKVLARLFGGNGRNVQDKSIVVEAAPDRGSTSLTEISTLPLDKEEESEPDITEAVIVAAANAEHSSRYTMQLLLDHKNDNAVVTERVLIAAAGSNNSTLPALLDYEGEKANISDLVLVAAAKNVNAGYFKFLLNRHKGKIQITDAVFFAAVGNSTYRKKYVRAIFDQVPNSHPQKRYCAQWLEILR
jgi:hypothetical protein